MNFDEIINRENTGSIKYDARQYFFKTDKVLPMSVADMDFRTPDFIVDAMKNRMQHEIFGYSLQPVNFKKSIIDWNNRRHNWQIDESWISYSPGVVSALSMAVMAFTKPKDKIIVQPPVYFPFFNVINGSDREIVHNSLLIKDGRYCFDYNDLEEKAKTAKMLLLCNPHNPGGMAWAHDELSKLADICQRYNVIVVSDEIHCDLVFPPFKHIPFANISDWTAKNSITTISASKTFNIAGLSTSVVIIPNAELFEKYDKVLKTIHLELGNIFGNIALEAAYLHGESWLDQLIDYLKDNRDYLIEYFNKSIPKVKVMIPESTYLVWLDFSGFCLSQKELVNKVIEEAGIGLVDGTVFGENGHGFLRMNFACPKDTLTKALNSLRSVFSNAPNDY